MNLYSGNNVNGDSNWLPLKGYDDYIIADTYPYAIMCKSSNRVVSSVLNNDGFCYSKLNGKRIPTHKLIAEMFVDNPNEYKYVIHRNGVKIDNHVDNLMFIPHRRMSNEFISKLSRDQIL